MNVSRYRRKVRRWYEYLKRRNPFKLERTEDGIRIRIEEYEYDPRDTGLVYIAVIDGQDADTYKAVKFGDDRALEYDSGSKQAIITSKPILIGDSQLYFTRPGYLGTIPINKETLLKGDVFKPSNESKMREIPKDLVDDDENNVELEKLGITKEELQNKDITTNEKGEDVYLVEQDVMGDVVALHGSKQTLKTMNEAKRMRKLLETSIPRKKILTYVGLGIGIGWIAYSKYGGA